MSEGVTSIIGAFTTALGTMATDVFGGIAQVLPVVLPIFAALIIIGIVVRIVKRISGRPV